MLRALFPRAVVTRFWLPLGVALLGGEGVARVVGAPDCAPVVPEATGWDTMIADARYLWKLEPDRLFESPNGNARTNAVGLRTTLLPTEPKREKRIVVTGDSSVYGWGQPDGKTYAERLEQALAEGLSTRVRVVNMGVPGFSTEQTRRLLDDLGWSYQPDLVVIHNIFSDCNIDAFQDREALALANPDESAVYRALHRSRLYCAAYMPLARFRATFQQEPDRVLMPGRPVAPDTNTRLEAIDQVVDLSRVPLDAYVENLAAIRDAAASHGAKMVVAPLPQEWDAKVWTVPGMAAPTAGQVLPWHPYRAAQREWTGEEGVGLIDLPAAFAAAPGEAMDLFIDHVHPSVWGARVMACAVATHVFAHPELLGLTAADVRSSECRLQPPPEGERRRRPGMERPQGPAPPPG